jgi:hypothetical protein
VTDVGAAVAIPFHDEGLGPGHLLGRDQTHAQTENLAIAGVLKRLIVDDGDAIAGAEGAVDEVVVAGSFGQPVRNCLLRRAAGGSKGRECIVEKSASKEGFQVFRETVIPGVVGEIVRPADQEWHSRRLMRAEHDPAESAGFGGEDTATFRSPRRQNHAGFPSVCKVLRSPKAEPKPAATAARDSGAGVGVDSGRERLPFEATWPIVGCPVREVSRC